MTATVIRIHNIFEPLRGQEAFTVATSLTIKAWLEKQGLSEFAAPTVCFYQGQPLLREYWAATMMCKGDTVLFVTLPLGSKFWKKLARTVLAVAAMAVAPGVGGMLAGSLGMGALGASVLTAGVAVSGAALTNLLIPPPRHGHNAMPSSGGYQSAQTRTISPTYSATYQGNQARLLQPIPVIYGRHKIFPDCAALPYRRYENNVQELYQLHCVGLGSYDIGEMRLGVMPLSSFDVIHEIIEPNSPIRLFDSSLVSVLEINGEVFASNEEGANPTLGPFRLNAPHTSIKHIECDIIAPRGLYYANNSGGLDSKSMSWQIWTRPINDDNEAIAEWTQLASETLSASTLTPQRKTYRYTVPLGRYELKITRTDAKDLNYRAGHTLHLESLKAYGEHPTEFKDITLIALKIKANAALAQTASRQFNCIVARKLPTWSPQTGWGEVTPTRSIAWAIADCAKSSYGAKLEDHRLDLEALYALDQLWRARSDFFDGAFDQRTTVWDALTKIARCGRSLPYLQGGILRLMRDSYREVPVALFTPRAIVKNSFKLQCLMPNETTADSVTVDYVNSKTWQSDEVTVSLPGSCAMNPTKVSLFGCTSLNQAKREAYYMAACNRYRRQIIHFETECEGFILTLGDLIAINHDAPRWGQAGDIVAIDGPMLTTSESLQWQRGKDHYISLKRKDGSLSGPWKVTRVSYNQVELERPLDFVPYTGLKAERATYAFGINETWATKARVLSIKPRSHTTHITAVIDHAAVHHDYA